MPLCACGPPGHPGCEQAEFPLLALLSTGWRARWRAAWGWHFLTGTGAPMPLKRMGRPPKVQNTAREMIAPECFGAWHINGGWTRLCTRTPVFSSRTHPRFLLRTSPCVLAVFYAVCLHSGAPRRRVASHRARDSTPLARTVWKCLDPTTPPPEARIALLTVCMGAVWSCQRGWGRGSEPPRPVAAPRPCLPVHLAIVPFKVFVPAVRRRLRGVTPPQLWPIPR